jgi:16S rRNA (cytidine1402-2'-O)-methyltransferase
VPLAVCATPIGNLDDVTLRVLHTLAAAEVVLCEDTRRTRILLGRHGIATPTRRFDAHAERRELGAVLDRLRAGAFVALVSDAGLPGVNDPGGRLVAAARAEGLETTVLPGPSAVETALVASGLGASRYRFLGYLPRGGQALTALWAELDGWDGAAVAFESPRRLPASLASLAAHDPARPVAVCRELTKRFEHVAAGPAGELAGRFSEPPKGEVTLVVAAPTGAPREADAASAVEAVRELVAAGTPRRTAAHVVARLATVPANRLYRASL